MMIGETLGHYRVLAQLGAGGMGVVWRAHDTALERDVALKVLPAEALTDERARHRLVREARLASQLNHPHICTIYEVCEADPSADSAGSPQAGSGQAVAFIAMELVEGQTLSARVAVGPLPIEQVLRYGQQMADALSHAHARGVVHRDFKSGNVVVTPDGQVKVLDFGLARQLTDEQLTEATTVSQHSLTAPGVVAGTLAYMAPEQLRGQAADARSDIWALGVVLYELAAGQRPFQGQTGFALSSAILSKPLPPLPSSVPVPLAGVIERCLAKEPGERYQQGSEVRAALEAVAAGEVGAAWSAWRVVLHRRRALLGAAGGALALLVVATLLFGLDVGGLRSRIVGGAGTPAHVLKLAVLPFANLSGNPDQEYLSDGLTQEMIAQLGRLHPGTLSVIARTSVMRYKNSKVPIDQIGRELGGVDFILEGSAQREANHVRIATELIKVADQTQVWSEIYEKDLSGILALQSDVARNVANALALTLLPAEQARLADVRTVNAEAYDAYLKGSQLWPKMTRADLDLAEKYFELALAKDPNYALAYVGMAWVWIVRNQMGFAPPGDALPRSKAAAQKAVQLDASLGEAHYALAPVLGQEWDWAGVDAEWRQAIELCPNLSDARAMYSHYLMAMHRPEEAMAQIQRALELDPINTMVKTFYAVDLFYVRRYDEAIEQLRMALRAEPENPAILNNLWLALARKGMEKEAFAAAKSYFKSLYGNPKVDEAFDRGWTRAGYKGGMKQAAEALEAGLREGYVAPCDIASLYLEAGDTDRALTWLEKGLDARDPTLGYLGLPDFDPVRSDPRFQAIVRKVGLPQ